jgi:hypothetical protein
MEASRLRELANHYEENMSDLFNEMMDIARLGGSSISVASLSEYKKERLIKLGYAVKHVQSGIQEWEWEISW